MSEWQRATSGAAKDFGMYNATLPFDDKGLVPKAAAQGAKLGHNKIPLQFYMEPSSFLYSL
jgi:hypothetical protein